MSSNTKLNTLILSGEGLTELPDEIFDLKNTLINLDISGNNFLDFESIIHSLKSFKNLKALKINIFTPQEAKFVIDNLPNLEYLNDEQINEEDQSNYSKESIVEYDDEDDDEEETIITIPIVKLVDKDFESVFKKLKEFYHYKNFTEKSSKKFA